MEHIDYAELVKLAGGAVTILLIGIAGFVRGRGEKKDQGDSKVEMLAGSLIDTRVLRETTDGLRLVRQEVERLREQQHDDSRGLRSAMEDMTIAIDRNTVAQGQGAVTPLELAKLIGTLKGA